MFVNVVSGCRGDNDDFKAYINYQKVSTTVSRGFNIIVLDKDTKALKHENGYDTLLVT